MTDDRFTAWLEGLEARHLADLTFSEVSRALRALSSAYVERRARLREGAALSGAGKRAAFALFYGPLHFLLVAHIARALDADSTSGAPLADLGCGTGAAGAAWAATRNSSAVVGIDSHPWAVDEARLTYRAFGVRGQARVGDAGRASFAPRSVVLAAFVVNELSDGTRDALLQRLLTHISSGGHALIVEPLAKGAAPWWNAWRREFETAGGSAEEWRVRAPLPPIVEKLDRAAGLRHREITGRSLFA